MNKIKQLNFKFSEEFYWKLKNFSTIKRLKMGEVLEQAFKFYEQREKTVQEINTYRQAIPAIESQMRTLQGNMSLKELEARVNNLNLSLFKKIGLTTTYRVLKETLEECLKLGKTNR